MSRKSASTAFVIAFVLFIMAKSCGSCSSPERVAKQDAKESACAIKNGDHVAFFETVKTRDKHFNEYLDEDIEKGIKGEKSKNVRYSDALDKYLVRYNAY